MVQARPSDGSSHNLWQLDDAKSPRQVSAQLRDTLQRNMYILILVLAANSIEPHSCNSSHVHQTSSPDTEQPGLGGDTTGESGEHHRSTPDGSTAAAEDSAGHADETAGSGTKTPLPWLQK